MAKPIVISVLADAAGVGKGTAQAEGFLGRMANKAKQVAKVVGVAVVAAGVAVAASTISAASQAEQSLGATEAIYGQYADGIIAKSKAAAQAVGLSANEYRELSNGLGSMLKNAGTPLDQLGAKTDRLVGLGSDLAAMYGGTTKDAVAALSSLMRGEADPIERYGVSIKQSDVNARMAAQGLSGLTGQALKTAEAEARLGLLFEQTADAQGRFSAESGTLAGQQQRLTAQFDNMKAALGARLLPIATATFGYLNDNAPAVFSAIQAAAEYVSPALSTLADGAIRVGAAVMSTVVPAARDAAPVIAAVAREVGAFTSTLVDRLAPGAEVAFGALKAAAPVALDAVAAAAGIVGPALGLVADAAIGVATAFSSTLTWLDQHQTAATVIAGVITGLLLPALTVLAARQTASAAASVAAWATKQRAAVTSSLSQVAALYRTAGAWTASAAAATRSGLLTARIWLMLKADAAKSAATQVAAHARTAAAWTVSTAAMVAQRATMTAVTAAQWLLNAAMSANPLGLIIVGLVAVGAGLALLWQNSETFRAIVTGAFDGVVAAGQVLWSGITTYVGLIGDAIGLYVGLIRKQIDLWVGAFRLVINAGREVVGAVTSAFNEVVTFIGGIPGKITGALGDLGGLLKGAGKKVIDGFVKGIKDGFGKVKDALGDLTGKLTSWKGPPKRDAVILRPAGGLIMDGLIAGFKDGEKDVKAYLTAFTDDVIGGGIGRVDLAPAFTADAFAAGVAVSGRWDDALDYKAQAGANGGNVYQITVEALTPNAEVGRVVVKAIKDYERIGGSL